MSFSLKQSWGRFSRVLATGFGAGYAPLIPGTVGSLWGLPLVWLLQRLFPSVAVLAVVAGLIFLLGIAVCHRAEREFEGKDPGQIVFDEIAAFPVVFLFTPIDWQTAAFGFVWFRLFDIVKPWPIRKLEKLPGGVGIMADDLMAGIYSAAALMFSVEANKLIQDSF